MSKFKSNWIISLQISYLSEATVANFQNNGKISILCVVKHCFLIGKKYCSRKAVV